MKRLIRLTSQALDRPSRVRVYVYDDATHMRRDAVAFSGDEGNGAPDVLGVTHAWTDAEGRAALCTIRLAREHLGTEVLAHEVHHATTALYGATLPEPVSAREVLSHFNEPFAHLYGQLLSKLVGRLYALGYYDGDEDES